MVARYFVVLEHENAGNLQRADDGPLMFHRDHEELEKRSEAWAGQAGKLAAERDNMRDKVESLKSLFDLAREAVYDERWDEFDEICKTALRK